MGLTFTKLGLFRKKEVKIIFSGLGCAGKTTILYKLKNGQTVKTTPTVGFEHETIEYKDVVYNVLELGGQTTYSLQQCWNSFFYDAKALVYVVDSADRERISSSKIFLADLLNTDSLRNASLLVFANQQDRPNAMKADEIIDELGLNLLGQRRWHAQSSCATTGEGLHDGFEWLSNNIDIQN